MPVTWTFLPDCKRTFFAEVVVGCARTLAVFSTTRVSSRDSTVNESGVRAASCFFGVVRAGFVGESVLTIRNPVSLLRVAVPLP